MLLLVMCLASGCADEPEPVALPDPPSTEQISEDLVGLRFDFFEDGSGARPWTIEAEEIRQLRIVDQVVDDSGRVARSRVALALRAEKRSIQGELILRHRREAPNWVFEGGGRSGPNWRAGDAEATLFAVRVLSDSTIRRRTLAFSPIARYENGRYLAPLAPYEQRARALFDSTFASDSLALAAETGLNRAAADALAPRGSKLYALGAGQPPAEVRVDSVRASLLGCQYVTAYADPPTPEAARWARLGTTSSVMGAPLAEGTALNRPLARALEGVARQRFEIAGVDTQRLRQQRAIAADLDGDGQDEAVGVFTIGEGERRRSLAVAASPGATAPRLLFERVPDRPSGFATLSLLGVLDVDADGAAEALFLEEGTEVYRYLIVTFRGGRFTDAFRGGGGGC
ncbi:hypothetical protein BSZ36_09120 [Rubricoccus marinus]|uniref:VCBS repeat-containing protein n=1 Tax=Rubricoccus marinus TaxID=716817 RepID=A0A259TZC6_9BACT|nr:hypothetical protein BSZ36_09120 [Rubricoccus marinus]